MVRLTDRPDMTLDVYRGRKTTIQYNTTYVTSREASGQPAHPNSLKNRLFSHIQFMNLGPVVQSIVSLTSSLRGQLVKCFMTL